MLLSSPVPPPPTPAELYPVVLAVAVHPPSTAATRLRAEQYRPALEAAGIELRLWTFLRERDLPDWWGPSTVRRLLVGLRALLRVGSALRAARGADVVIVQREALPFGPPLLEALLARGRRCVWDIDDALWIAYVSPTAGRVPRWLRAPSDKYRRLCSMADEVWAGSEHLAEWCRQHSSSVHVVPTVVSVPSTRLGPRPGRTVGWIGSHSTATFLADVLPHIAAVDPPPTVIVVGGHVRPQARLDIDERAWSEQAEAAALADTRVGLYPIDRHHPLADGKCGLKAILFMSAGVPPVVTPTATNAIVVRDGVEGFHADGPAAWTAAVQRLLDDEELWESCSRAAHARALADYSLETWSPRVVQRLAALAAAGRAPRHR